MIPRYVFIAMLILAALFTIPRELAAQTTSPSCSAFPILNYSSDTGFGFGGKGVLKRQLHHDESFDLILFASSKGEQWYAFTFALPDPEIRQGRRYAMAFELKLEYDKMLRSNFFGNGNAARDNVWQFSKEQTKLELLLGHAFSPRLIGEVGYRLVQSSVYGFDAAWGTISSATPGAGESRVAATSLRLRWDTRDSALNPHRGQRLLLATEIATPHLGSDWNFKKYRAEASAYHALRGNHVLAVRLWLQHVVGAAPYLELSKIGDSWTARGYKADRFLDRAATLASLEYRYPVYHKLGGVLFVDAGHVWPDLTKFGLEDWHVNWGAGARYYLTNFVVRFDAGFSHEGTRIFFQFGQVF